MKTELGGDRLGSGSKNEVTTRHFNRSTHDLSYLWRSSAAPGTLIPFMSQLALPGDSWDIDLNCEVLTLPTVGPLFGSFKVQLDIFQIPCRLYNSALITNRLDIGRDMSQVALPQIELQTNNHANYVQTYEDNEQINASSIMKYLGVSGFGRLIGATNPATRQFNAVPLLSYWDIYKQYYANKQEEIGYVIHHTADSMQDIIIERVDAFNGVNFLGEILLNPTNVTVNGTFRLEILIDEDTNFEPDPASILITLNGNSYAVGNIFSSVTWDETTRTLFCDGYNQIEIGTFNIEVTTDSATQLGGSGTQINIEQFELDNIDEMRDRIIQHPFTSGAFVIDNTTTTIRPYTNLLESAGGANEDLRYSIQFNQEGLGLKTYQSDLFNNWIETEWIDGASGVNEITKVDTTGNSFTIDSLNLANKVYNMLNRIALSGGTYDDYLDAVYDHDRVKAINSPVYHGSLIKELGFQEVISNGETNVNDNNQPLGTLAGRGQLTNKNKGGKTRIKVDEPSYIMGIFSLTPRIDYSQGNKWDMNLKTYDDFHKPDLDAIGFQDLITDQMCWTDTDLTTTTGVLTFNSAGKQPAWINYMTEVNRVYGNFAEQSKDMFMVNNRRYDKDPNSGAITDLTTYIDPTKYNHIFAQTELDAQNFWVQISNKCIVRRKMSAKQIPNL